LEPVENARNSLLKFWKENGGRTALLKGLQNVFIALEKPIRTIASAFRMVFPAIDSKKIVDLSTAFEAFTKKLIPSNNTLQKLGDTFYFVFSAGKVVVDWIKALGKGALTLLGAFKPLLGLVLDLFGGLGSGVDILDGNTKAIDWFTKAVLWLADGILTITTGIRNFTNGALGGLKPILSDIGNLFRFVAGEVQNFGGLLGRGAGIVKNLFSSVAGAFGNLKTGGVKGFFQAFKDGFASLRLEDKKLEGSAGVSKLTDNMAKAKTWLEKLKDAFQWLGDKAKSIFGAIGNFFKPITDKIKELVSQFNEKLTADNILTFLRDFNWEGLLKGIGALLAGKGFGGLMKSFKQWGDSGKGFMGMVNSISNTIRSFGNDTMKNERNTKAFFEGLKNSLKEFTVGIKAGAVLKIAIALLALAVAVSIAVTIDNKPII
jgi:hypothetical protein